MKPRVLFLAPSYASAPDTGGGQRTMLLYEALASAYHVDALIVDEWGAQGAEKQFARGGFDYLRVTRPGKRGISRFLQGVNPSLADTAATALRGRRILYEKDPDADVDFDGYDAVVSRYLRPAAQAGAVGANTNTPALIDVDDRDDQVLDARLAESRNPAARALLKSHRDQMRNIFGRLTQGAAHLWAVTDEDRKAIEHRSVSLLPNIPFHIPEGPPPAARGNQTILFVGAGGHRPNVEGIIRFVENAWPAIRAEAPDATLRIVGSGPWARHAEKLSAQNVELVGRVNDVGAEYAGAALAICPVFEGGGSKIKVLEAFAYNRPMVSAAHSARGFVAGLAESALLSASDEAGMAASCLKLIKDPADAARRAAAGRQIVLETYSREAFTAAVLQACDKVLNNQANS